MLNQVGFGEIMHRPPRFAFEGIRLGFLTLPKTRFLIGKDDKIGKPRVFQFVRTLLHKQLSFRLTEEMQDIKAIDSVILLCIAGHIQNRAVIKLRAWVKPDRQFKSSPGYFYACNIQTGSREQFRVSTVTGTRHQ